ncbi:ubiquinol oxidase 2, mitochondrial-like isoform X2 [Salvia miltiorrhiza]|uniref:ubiquinol oxidase 2, mitochondrial-like isoform X2 n=1 Tax=Salvia miltiorrhiza TaxID=226208 RepID=UPI0025AC9A9F|nr:ubiquinol oxidase 2, mitochondrial-like isoform X2 [Salvia miltiorrhiza]
MSRRAVLQVSKLLDKQSRNTTAIFNGATKISKNSTFANYEIFRVAPVLGGRHQNNTISSVSGETKEEKTKLGLGGENVKNDQGGKSVVSSYWGVATPQVRKADGSPWRWNCFRPWETYTADTTIDVKKHHEAKTFMDKFAYWTVQSLKYPTHLFFQRRHMCHAMLLETVAAVPGMVGGMMLHLKSLRRFEQSGGWIKALLEEAENERMHLMTFLELSQPKWTERALVIAVQGVFFNAYFAAYLLSPKLAHRIVGYLEEEAVNSYTDFLHDLEKGIVQNQPAPAIAIDYWRLPPNSTLKDVVTVIRADEAHHRDLNHFASVTNFSDLRFSFFLLWNSRILCLWNSILRGCGCKIGELF